MSTRPSKDSDKLSLYLFIAALCAAAFGLGFGLRHLGLPPTQQVENVVKTARMAYRNMVKPAQGGFLRFETVAPKKAAENRVTALAPVPDDRTYLLFGGLRQYADLHPETGCLAVKVDRQGNVRHAYPYRPQALMAADSDTEAGHEDSLGFTFAHKAYPVGMAEYDNGDLLVLFQGHGTFPYAQGIARVTPDGAPVWFRRDYTHHWPTLLADGTALVPASRIGQGSRSIALPDGHDEQLSCPTDKPLEDLIRVIGPDGAVLEEISVMDALLDSPWRSQMLYRARYCDPVHLNHVSPVGPDMAEALPGIEADDYLVSLRNISAIGIIGRKDHDLKLLRMGSFTEQHSAHQYRGSEVVLFDNLGGNAASNGPSRLLAVDLATGAERTIFPNADTPEDLQHLFSLTAGHITLSGDHSTALVAFTKEGVGVELDMDSGRVLTVFKNLHDVSSVDAFAADRETRAALYSLYGVAYARSPR